MKIIKKIFVLHPAPIDYKQIYRISLYLNVPLIDQFDFNQGSPIYLYPINFHVINEAFPSKR